MIKNILRQFRGEALIELSAKSKSLKIDKKGDLLTLEYGYLRLIAKNESELRRISIYENETNRTQTILFGWADDKAKGKLNAADFGEAYENRRLKDFLVEAGGSFFLIINGQSKTMLATNRFGNIPLFVYQERKEKKAIFIATRLVFLLEHMEKKCINAIAGLQTLKYGYCLGDQTLVQNIKVLSPASLYSWDGDHLNAEKYWRCWEEEETEQWDRLEDWYHGFIEIIDKYISGEENINLGLSGGLDSRLLLGMLLREKKEIRATTFYGGTDCGDLDVARRLAQKTGIEHREVEIKLSNFQSEARNIIDANSGISINSSYLFWELGKSFAENRWKYIYIAGFYWGGKIPREIEKYGEKQFIEYLIQMEALFNNEFLKRFVEEDSLEFYSKAEIEDIHPGVHAREGKDFYRILKEWDIYQRYRRFLCQNVPSVLNCWVDTFEPFFGSVPISLLLNIPNRQKVNREFQKRLICKLFPDLAKIPESLDGLPIKRKFIFRSARSALLRMGGMGENLIRKSKCYSNFEGAYNFFQNWWQLSDGEGIQKTIEEIDWARLGLKKNLQFKELYKEACARDANGHQVSLFLYNLFTIATGMIHWNLSYPD